MVGGSLILSVAVLVVAFAVLSYSVFSFAHVRISDVDMTELDRLRREGILPDKPRLVEDFDLIHAKIAHVAPAVYLRQEFWLRLYFHLLRAARTVRPNAAGLDRELLRLSAYQAHHYWVAMKRLDALRNPSL